MIGRGMVKESEVYKANKQNYGMKCDDIKADKLSENKT